MSTLVSTGQFTIVDQNDARPISIGLSTNYGTQQVYTKQDDTAGIFTPSWFTNNLVITPTLSIGGLTPTESWARVTSRAFSLTRGGTAITAADANPSNTFVDNSDTTLTAGNIFALANTDNGNTNAPTLTIKGNLSTLVKTFTLYFSCIYTDTTTGLSNTIESTITLTSVATGTNATYISIRGVTAIEESNTSTKNAIAVAADLVRGGIIDTTGLTYKWYDTGASTQISTSTPSYTTKYALSTSTYPVAPTAVTINGANVPVLGAGNSYNTLSISENAVNDIGVYRVDITDGAGTTYSQTFIVTDYSDPYDVKIASSAGDKLLNGVGSTNLSPIVYNGATRVTDLSGWTFNWTFYAPNGYRAAFVDPAKLTGGRTITANTTGTSATFTYSGTADSTLVAGNIVKCVKPSGIAFYYEVASIAGNVVTIRTPSTNTWLTFTNFPAPSASTDFVNGKIFYGVGLRSTTGSTAITVGSDDIDGKANIVIEANRP